MTPSTSSRVARVVIDSPLPQLDRLFDYAIPPELAAGVTQGCLVRVPLRTGQRQVLAYVVSLESSSEFSGTLASISEVVSSQCILPEELYTLARSVADRQVGTVSDVLRQAIPRRYVRAEKAYVASTGQSRESSRDALTSQPEETRGSAERVAEHSTARPVRASTGEWTTEWALRLATRARATWDTGGSSLLIVPDFRDIDRLVQSLDILGLADAVCRLDANTPPAERWVNYLRCMSGELLVVIGNRSAMYAPLKRPALIAMWDDGDPVYQEQMAPYSHARDIALLRQEQSGCDLVFLFDSPSTDLVRLVELGWLRRASDSGGGPRIIPVDNMTQEGRTGIPSVAWQRANEALRRGPILIQVPRPGFAQVLLCASCRAVARCTACGGPLRRRSRGAGAECRWCGVLATAWSCESCRATQLRDASLGSDATAEQMGKAFPGFPVVVSSGERLVTEVTTRAQIVVSTPGVEPFCPGGYSLVIIVDADRLLMSDRLRVVENALRLWTHACAHVAADGVAYIVGTGRELGQVLATRTQWECIANELVDRRALHLPPAARMATLTGTRATVEDVIDSIPPDERLAVLGPVPAGDDGVRAVVSFPYKHGDAVTARLRTSVVASIAGGARRRAAPGLRVRLDETALSGT